MERKTSVVYAFIDSQNLNLGVRALGWKLDFQKFRIYLQDKLGVQKAFLFLGYVDTNQKMYSILRSFGYELVFKPMVRTRRSIKGNVDAELVLYAAKVEYPNYDKAVIISGDGDFYCLLSILVREGRLLRLVIPSRKSQSSLLREFEEYKLFVEKIRSKVEKQEKGKTIKWGALYSARKLNSAFPPRD